MSGTEFVEPPPSPGLLPRREGERGRVIGEFARHRCNRRLPSIRRKNRTTTRRTRIAKGRRTILPLLGGEGRVWCRGGPGPPPRLRHGGLRRGGETAGAKPGAGGGAIGVNARSGRTRRSALSSNPVGAALLRRPIFPSRIRRSEIQGCFSRKNRFPAGGELVTRLLTTAPV